MKLVIAEKPSVAAEIAKALGGSVSRADGYLTVGDVCLSWCFGHLVENAKPDEYDPKFEQWKVEDLPFIPEKFIVRPRSKKDSNGRDLKNSDGSIKLDDGIVKQLNTIRGLLSRADSVINSGDSAREGQLIIDEILTYFEYNGPVQRLWLQEMNLPAIKKAWANMRPNSDYLNLYKAAMGRSSLDFLIGMNCTRGYTIACKSKGHNTVLHIGRVQTPTISLVVGRDLEIEKFKAKDYYILRAKVIHTNGDFWATWVPAKEASFLDAEGRVATKAAAEEAGAKVKGKMGALTSVVTTPKSISPPLPFSLGDLQKTAFKRWGLSATQTLELAQSLYETHKLLSYPRTDYSYLPEGDHAHGEAILLAAKGNLGPEWDFGGTPDYSLRSPAWNDSKIGDHFAIRPTDRGGYDVSKLSTMEFNIYKLVVRQFLAQFYPPHKYDTTTVEISSEAENFKASGKVEKQEGWRVLFSSSSKSEGDQPLPQMNSGDSCTIPEVKIESKKTSPPARFDTASLVEAMENPHLYVTDEKVKKLLKATSGIGTPATRANIIEFAIKREYLQEVSEGKRKYFISTEKGRFLYQIVPDWLKKPDLTAYFEDLLKQVENGELPYENLLLRQRQFVEKLIGAVKDGSVANNMPAPGSYQAPLRVGKSGKRVKAVGKMDGGASKATKKKPNEIGCPKCGSGLKERNGKNGPFLGCSAFPNCTHTEPIPGQVKQER